MRLRIGLALTFLLAVSASLPAQRGNDIFVTPIANVPFTGTVEVQRSEIQPDGRAVDWKTVREIGRDSSGRIYQVIHALVPPAANTTPPVLRIHQYDPQTRISSYLYPREHKYSAGVVDRPPATEPPNLVASPAARALPPSQYASEENLGTREIDGVVVHGVRNIQVLPADYTGAKHDIAITDEYWYSEDLHMNLSIRHDDPRTGSYQMTVTKVSRVEPDPAMFAVPMNYKPTSQRDR